MLSFLAVLFGTLILSYRPSALGLGPPPFPWPLQLQIPFLTRHLISWCIFSTSSTLPCCFQDSSLDSQPSSPLPSLEWLQPQPSNGTALPWPGRGISPRAAAIQVAIHRRKEPEASWLGEGWRLGRSSFIMESYNDVLIQCHLSFIIHFIVQLYTLHTSTWWTTDANVLLSFDFYFGPIHIEHQVEVRLMRLQIMKLHDAVELVHQLIWNTPNRLFSTNNRWN